MLLARRAGKFNRDGGDKDRGEEESNRDEGDKGDGKRRKQMTGRF
jgi:hypothetical protein